ncbi:MAG: SEC-C metal-binding domain-containing protein [Candidatus Contendobacter sp.]|nr:SEC-C metal-binding domain-containing protein [Candidatus Contendobacter sp.]MDG4557089.1 SEC-C metal-binding domain-containing protein [Candidatus Contendobacter sp.]
MPWTKKISTLITSGFEATSKRKRGFPSETRVKRGERAVKGDKELLERLGRNDPCPCQSGRRFQELLHARRSLRRQ